MSMHYPDQAAAYMEDQVQQERAEASLDRLLSAPPLTPHQCLVDNAWALREVCERALTYWPETEPEYDEDDNLILPPLVIPHELAMDIYRTVRAAKGEV